MILLIPIVLLGSKCEGGGKFEFEQDSKWSEHYNLKLAEEKIQLKVTGAGNTWHTGSDLLYNLVVNIQTEYELLEGQLTFHPERVDLLFNGIPMSKKFDYLTVIDSTNGHSNQSLKFYCSLYKRQGMVDSLSDRIRPTIAIDLSNYISSGGKYIFIDTIYATDRELVQDTAVYRLIDENH